MSFITHLIHFILHIDLYLTDIVNNYGHWIYAFLFLIIFSESAFVFIPFLPGDSILIAAGAIAASSSLNVYALIVLLIIAATLGGMLNYWIGNKLGHLLFTNEKSFFFKKSYLDKTHEFFERYGAKTIFIARFLPIIRTFAPFVAGLGKMRYLKFCIYNFSSAILWIILLTYISYLYGNIPIIKNNFSLVILAIIIISLLPAIIGFLKLQWDQWRKSA